MTRIAAQCVFSVAVVCCFLFLAVPTGFAQNGCFVSCMRECEAHADWWQVWVHASCVLNCSIECGTGGPKKPGKTGSQLLPPDETRARSPGFEDKATGVPIGSPQAKPKAAYNIKGVQPPAPVAPPDKPSPVKPPPAGKPSADSESQGPGPLGPGPLPDEGPRKSRAPPPDILLSTIPPEREPRPAPEPLPLCDESQIHPMIAGPDSLKNFKARCSPCAAIERKYYMAQELHLCAVRREVSEGRRYAREVRDKYVSPDLTAEQKKSLGKRRLEEGKAHLEPYRLDIIKKAEEEKKLETEMWHCQHSACPQVPEWHKNSQTFAPPKIVPPPLGR